MSPNGITDWFFLSAVKNVMNDSLRDEIQIKYEQKKKIDSLIN